VQAWLTSCASPSSVRARAQLNLPVTPYPPTKIQGVAVKVPQFSFSRLSGYAPVPPAAAGLVWLSTGR